MDKIIIKMKKEMHNMCEPLLVVEVVVVVTAGGVQPQASW